MSPVPVTVQDARVRARTSYDRKSGSWAAAEALATSAGVGSREIPVEVPRPAGPLMSLPLHPPTEGAALADQSAAVSWVRSWSAADAEVGTVRWGTRRWANLGTQRVPERLEWGTPVELARAAGRTGHWTQLTARFAALLRDVPGRTDDLAAALPGAAASVSALDDADFRRLLGVLSWLARHPDSGMYIRQLPIRGVDSKWVGSHRGLVRRLHTAASGRQDLGLAVPPELIRVRFLDPGLAPGGLIDLTAPLTSLARLEIEPRTVFVVENLETILAVPALPGAVAVHGRGYAVDSLSKIPWVGGADVVYWGDLDSHGFAILHRLRSHGVPARSVLMDTETLEAFADLCEPEPRPSTGELNLLTAQELATLRVLAERGHVRLEQERIDWNVAVAALTQSARERNR